MGLDMYLFKLKREALKNPTYNMDNDADEVMYWRKANAIHYWFTEGYPNDNLEYLECEMDKLQVLKEQCEQDIKNRDDDSYSPKLQTASGFFWGSLEYDDWHYDQLQKTIDKIKELEEEHKEGDEYFYYAWY
jgi:hypothetical protein